MGAESAGALSLLARQPASCCRSGNPRFSLKFVEGRLYGCLASYECLMQASRRSCPRQSGNPVGGCHHPQIDHGLCSRSSKSAGFPCGTRNIIHCTMKAVSRNFCRCTVPRPTCRPVLEHSHFSRSCVSGEKFWESSSDSCQLEIGLHAEG